jgi:hypothetical protein
MRRLAMAALAAAALLSAACKVRNPAYCGDRNNFCGDATMSVDVPGADGGGDHADAAAGCRGNGDCRGASGGAVCDVDAGLCVGCVADGDCRGAGGLAVCEDHACVACRDDASCGGTTPVCETASHTCRACRADSECTASGVCVGSDGHCAVAGTEVVYAGKGDWCTGSGGGDGSRDRPFCMTSEAVGALGAQRNVLAIRGAMPVGPVTVAAPAVVSLLVVGGAGASILTGAGDAAGIHVSGAINLTVRDLSITGAAIGLLADNGAHVVVTRCVLRANLKGGVQISDGSYDITNSIIAGNGPGTVPPTTSWGGVYLGATATGRLANDTVVANNQVGVVCAASQIVDASIVYSNVGGQTLGCTEAVCCGADDTVDPKLDTGYHLQSGSPCLDKLTPDPLITVDIDGDHRPSGAAAKSDCGADELP